MTDHDLDARLRSKYHARSTDAASPTLARRVLAIPAQSPPRRGWLPRLIDGGRSTVFNATTAAAAVAVLAVSGTLLVSQIGTERTTVPGSTTINMELSPGYVDGTVTLIEEPDYDATPLGEGYFQWITPVATLRWETDDQRLSGDATAVEHGMQHFNTWNGVRTIDWTLENDGGSWTGTGNAFSRADGGEGFVILDGHGDYDGLSAFVSFGREPEDSFTTEVREIRGVIFPAAPPTAPGRTTE